MQKCCTVPKKQKHQSLETLGSSRAWRSPNFGWDSTAFLLVFAEKRLVFLGQYSVFAVPGLESAVLSQKNNLCKAKSAKMLYCPKKKKQSLETLGSSRAWRSPNFGFFGFFGTVRHFCLFWLKKVGFFGTVQRFCSPRPRKCCTVPKKPIFLRQKVQKCCTVQKNQKTKVWRPWAPPGPGGLQTLVFLLFWGQYGIFACFCLKR